MKSGSKLLVSWSEACETREETQPLRMRKLTAVVSPETSIGKFINEIKTGASPKKCTRTFNAQSHRAFTQQETPLATFWPGLKAHMGKA